MKISIAGEEYELTEAVRSASTGTLKSMKNASELSGPAVTIGFLEDQIERIDKLSEQPDFKDVDLYGDVDYLSSLAGFVYLAKRFAGEQVTWDQADGYAPHQITFVAVEAVPADPKDAAPADETTSDDSMT